MDGKIKLPKPVRTASIDSKSILIEEAREFSFESKKKGQNIQNLMKERIFMVEFKNK